MTTHVTVHVNGSYRAHVLQTQAGQTVPTKTIVEGNYPGSPNPSGEHSFHLAHPASASFEITEEYIPS